MPVRKTSPRKVAEQSTPTVTAAAPPKLDMPRGKWTVLRFPTGSPAGDIEGLVVEAMAAARRQRAAGQVWVAMLGEFFMGEGAPILLISPHVPASVLHGMNEFLEMMGPPTMRKEDPRTLAFRGKSLLRFQDGFEKVYLGQQPDSP